MHVGLSNHDVSADYHDKTTTSQLHNVTSPHTATYRRIPPHTATTTKYANTTQAVASGLAIDAKLGNTASQPAERRSPEHSASVSPNRGEEVTSVPELVRSSP
jgi:hypothetical protein